MKNALRIADFCIGKFEENWLGKFEGRFLLGEEFSDCDRLAVCELLQLNFLGYDLEGKYPGVLEWVKACGEDWSVVEGNLIVKKICEKRGIEFWLE